MRLQLVLVLGLEVCFCIAESSWSFFGSTFSLELNDENELVTNFIKNDDDDDIDPSVKEDERLTTTQLITKYGYPAEIHHVITDDGYILEMHRIPKPGKTPVLMVHGLLDSSSTWVMMGPDKGFAYMLSDLHYDVWMANVRGNTYSKNHTTLNPRKAKFWDFSFHEMGIHDIPKSIDYVLEVTGFTKLQYIGHSQGTTCFWIMCSLLPQYNDKIISMQALAPAAFIEDSKSPVITFLSFFRSQISYLLKIIGAHEFLPNGSFVKYFSQFVCDDDSIVQSICSQVMFIIVGFDKAQMNHTMLPVILGHSPAGSSTKQLIHFAQLKSSGHFRQFDHGYIGNWRRYGRFSPPDYPLENVMAKVALHYGANDWLTVPKDVDRLDQALPNVIGKFLVKFSEFNHLDFVWGIDARELLYNKVSKLMKAVEDDYL
ncbi:lipase 1-like [Episyrphus balteatus]|uniref:lipase 1-like n=1 Tax=Episyrphus balteatus TaxID=286459 RepID=UPI0024863804|nr:lipase 1-like [Episyrphus balteatus]